ncbi:MAG TPA: hypothetical protein VFT37_07625 [Telluria sp.]|nr:hypothetical protein [Telluria sp.]
MHQFSLPKTLTAAVLCAAQLAAHAAELGDPVVKSHIGQPLVADIELLAEEGGAVRATIAHDDVYRGANIARSPVIDTLHMSVMRRDGRQFLHITSIKPVEAGYLHLFLELNENGKRDIRPATLWLTPEPPAPPRRSVAPVPAPATEPAPSPAPAARPRAARAPDLACQALDYKNAQLAAQIVDLEEKVKALQATIDLQVMPDRPGVVAAPVAKPAVPKNPKAAKGGVPGWIAYAGVGLVVVLGGGGLLRRRRRLRADDRPIVDARPGAVAAPVAETPPE